MKSSKYFCSILHAWSLDKHSDDLQSKAYCSKYKIDKMLTTLQMGWFILRWKKGCQMDM